MEDGRGLLYSSCEIMAWKSADCYNANYIWWIPYIFIVRLPFQIRIQVFTNFHEVKKKQVFTNFACREINLGSLGDWDKVKRRGVKIFLFNYGLY